jgi:hypothetical protein
MHIQGCLSEFSLAHVLQLVHQHQWSGCIAAQIPTSHRAMQMAEHLIWFSQGRLVAANDGGYQDGIFGLVAQYGWLSDRVASQLWRFFPGHLPAGQYLRSQGAVSNHQLNHLFQEQVVQRVQQLCQQRTGEFMFDSAIAPPMHELTGMSIAALEVTESKNKLKIADQYQKNTLRLSTVTAELRSSRHKVQATQDLRGRNR